MQGEPRAEGAGAEVIRPVTEDDHAELFAAFARIVADDEGYPQDPAEPLTFEAFRAYWLAPAAGAWVATVDGHLAGASMMKPINVGRAAHIANAGYFVAREHRGRGLGRRLVEHSLVEARRLGFDAMQFNYVFASNPARALYERLGFRVIGEVPDVIDGEAVVIYWRHL